METFTWQTPEYHHQTKSKDWYWTVGIITAALVITAAIFGNVLFGLVLAIGVFTLTVFTARKPNTVTVIVDNKGVRVDKTLYPYSTLEAFGLDTEHHHGPRLYLKSKKVMVPLVMIPVRTEDLDGLRILLVKHLKEETFEENLMQTLLERLGF
jgi:hypothetical protein